MDLSITKDSLPKAITAFGLDLYKKLNKSDVCKNIFLSPMSISTALGIVLVGAWGNTKTQMGKVLHFDRSLGSTRSYAFQRRMADVSEPERENVDGKINLEVKKLLSQLNHLNPGYQMNIANNLFIQNGYDFFQQYLVCIKDVYGATLESVDFFNATEEARQTINLEVEKQTQGKEVKSMLMSVTRSPVVANTGFLGYSEAMEQDFLLVKDKLGKSLEARSELHKPLRGVSSVSYRRGNIKELFPPGVIGSDTVLVLANAIYFKATWEHQFDPSRTTEKDFRLNENESKPVQMMHQRGRFQLGLVRSINAQILCLPYVGELLSMIILLPKDIGDLEQVENSMTCETLADWTSQQNMMENHVEVYLPRFKLEDTFDLNITLQALGMTDVFDQSKADLSGMSPSQQLFLSKVIHKAYVDVNEVGTEAAAATGASVSSRSLISYELFLADHPFLFCIRHNPTNTILFLGKFCSP